ncbi:hypothetical protein BGW37DRAFT_526428 [Umbelopsis sp. PMI_123]|nr:hypothetical protein BGW37DRAFT_526428 [Umbelopsis sp. PMI_123]
MSTAGPAYEIRFRDDEHVQIIDLTRNGTGPESRPLPSIYRQSCLLRRESVLLSHSTSEPTFSRYDNKDNAAEELLDEDTRISSLAVSRDNTHSQVTSQPIPIQQQPPSSETQHAAKSAPHRRGTSSSYPLDVDTSYSWTGRSNKDLDVIPTVARRLAEEEALDSLRRQEGEEAMRKALERKAKIAAARQHSRTRSGGMSDVKDEELNTLVVENYVTSPTEQSPFDKTAVSGSFAHNGDANANRQSLEQNISQSNRTVDIKSDDTYRLDKKDMDNVEEKQPALDSQPNVYPYKPQQKRMDKYIRYPPKGHLGDAYQKAQQSNMHEMNTFKYQHGRSMMQDDRFQAQSQDTPSHYLAEETIKAEEKQGCCCIIS